MKYIIVKNGLVDNFIVSDSLPVTSSDEIALLNSNYNVRELKTPYDAENNIFLTKFKGSLTSTSSLLTTDPIISVDLNYNKPITSISQINIHSTNASLDNFIVKDSGASFDLILNEEIVSSSVEEIIKVNVDEHIKSVDGYTTIVPSLEFKYTGSL